MYQPPHFKEERTDVLHDLIRTHPLATLITLDADGLNANHIPMVLHQEPDGTHALQAHVSRANPLWSKTDFSVEALVVFQGPQHYIAPAWYPSKAEHGKVVPTWNYIVVHAHGPMQIIEDATWLHTHLQSLTHQNEAKRAEPWAVTDAPDAFVTGQIKGIVGINVPITRLEGKWKVSQNRSDPDRNGVINGLIADADLNAIDLAGRVPQ